MKRRLVLVRHAQASFGAEDYDALSDVGHEQCAHLKRALAERFPEGPVVTGRMRRHRQTAQGALPGRAAREDAGWDEYDHDAVLRAYEPRYATRAGIAEDILGHEDPARAFSAIFAKAVARWASGAHDADYGEPWSAFQARVEAAMDRAAEGTSVVVTSGGAILVACRRALELSPERAISLGWSLVNASITVLDGRDAAWRLHSFNEHGHLPAGLVTRR